MGRPIHGSGAAAGAASRPGRTVFVLPFLAASLFILSAPPAAVAGPPVPGGEATLVSVSESRSIESGGSAEAFSLRLPTGAACPGDSANDGYRVQSYMVPVAVDPSTLEYDVSGPVPNSFGDGTSFRQPLYDVSTSPFIHAQTTDAATSGAPGFIVNIPSFSYAVYRPGELPPGPYAIGIACTLANRTVRHWGVEVEVADAPDDEPAGVRWARAGGSGGAAGSGWRNRSAAVATASVAMAAGIALVTTRRRGRRQTAATPMEDR